MDKLGEGEGNLKWETSIKVTKLRSFLGLANYYRKFVKGYSRKTTPLIKLLKNSIPWKWFEECQVAVDNLKWAMYRDPIHILL